MHHKGLQWGADMMAQEKEQNKNNIMGVPLQAFPTHTILRPLLLYRNIETLLRKGGISRSYET